MSFTKEQSKQSWQTYSAENKELIDRYTRHNYGVSIEQYIMII